jgi:hypothetical protein
MSPKGDIMRNYKLLQKHALLMIGLFIASLALAACGGRNEPALTSQLKPTEAAVSEVAQTPTSEPIVTPTTEHTARPDPAAIVLAYQEALNAHDLDSALSLFADDFEYHDFGGLILNRSYMNETLNILIPRIAQVEALGIKVNGSQVEWLMRFTLRSGSIDEIEFEAIIKDEKITSLTEQAVSIGSYIYRNPQYPGSFRKSPPTSRA